MQKPPSVTQWRVTTAAGVFVADTKCGAPAVLEPVVPEDADLGLIKDTVDTEGNQTSCDQQQLRSSAEAPMADSVPVPDVASRGAGNAEDLSESEQLADSPITKSEIAKAVGSSSSSLLPDSVPPATSLISFPVMLPIKQPPPMKAQSNSVATSILTAAEQFEMQAAFAYAAALAKQIPVPRGLLVHNLLRANALLPECWQALSLEEGQLYFCDTVRGYTTFAYPDRPAGVDPHVVASSRGEGYRLPKQQ